MTGPAHSAETERHHTLLAIIALKAAHDDEGCCSCPWDRCLLGKPWVKRLLKEKADVIELVLGKWGPIPEQIDGDA